MLRQQDPRIYQGGRCPVFWRCLGHDERGDSPGRICSPVKRWRSLTCCSLWDWLRTRFPLTQGSGNASKAPLKIVSIDLPMDLAAPKGSAPWARAMRQRMLDMLKDAKTGCGAFVTRPETSRNTSATSNSMTSTVIRFRHSAPSAPRKRRTAWATTRRSLTPWCRKPARLRWAKRSRKSRRCKSTARINIARHEEVDAY